MKTLTLSKSRLAVWAANLHMYACRLTAVGDGLDGRELVVKRLLGSRPPSDVLAIALALVIDAENGARHPDLLAVETPQEPRRPRGGRAKARAGRSK